MAIGSGYIQRQNEAVEICKICKYKAKANKYDSLIKEIEDKFKTRRIELLKNDKEPENDIVLDTLKELLDTEKEKI